MTLPVTAGIPHHQFDVLADVRAPVHRDDACAAGQAVAEDHDVSRDIPNPEGAVRHVVRYAAHKTSDVGVRVHPFRRSVRRGQVLHLLGQGRRAVRNHPPHRVDEEVAHAASGVLALDAEPGRIQPQFDAVDSTHSVRIAVPRALQIWPALRCSFRLDDVGRQSGQVFLLADVCDLGAGGVVLRNAAVLLLLLSRDGGLRYRHRH